MARKRQLEALARIDEGALASFRAGLRRRYSDRDLLNELKACASRLGRSPTMREFESDALTIVHPQTVIERFGSWNAAKRRAGLVPRRYATRADLLRLLSELGAELGRVPTSKDLEARRGRMPSKSLYWHTFGSLTAALREAGFDIPIGEERLERAIDKGAELARRLERLPRFADWAVARKADPSMLTEWQVYRELGSSRGAWSAVQYLIRERLVTEGLRVDPSGRVRAR